MGTQRDKKIILFILFIPLFCYNVSAQSLPPIDSARILIKKKSYQEAIEILKQQLKKSNNAAFWRLLGAAYGQTSKFDQAVEAYEKAAIIDSCDSCYSDYEMAGIYSTSMGKINQASKYYDHAIMRVIHKHGNLAADLFRGKASIYEIRHEYSSAIEAYWNALEYSEDSTIYKHILSCFESINDHHSVIAISDGLIHKHPNWEAPHEYASRANVRIGDQYYYYGDCTKANEYYNRALSYRSSYALPYYCLCKSYSELKQYDKAIINGERAIQFEMWDMGIYSILGELYSKVNRLEKAEVYLRFGLMLDRNNLSLWNTLRNVFNKLHKPEELKACDEMINKLNLQKGEDSFQQSYSNLLSKKNLDVISHILYENSLAIIDTVKFDNNPIITQKITPEYPYIAERANLEGEVWLKMQIDKSGRPKYVTVMISDAEIFNEPSINAALQYRFTPAQKDNKPVEVWIAMPFHFKHTK
jgi:TonB family protein